MARALFAVTSVRPEERRDVWAAFALLFVFIGSHATLETARDALFLAKVPATRLPWVYLAIAAASLAAARLQARLGGRLAGRAALGVWAAVAAAVTFGFYGALDALGPAGFYALYVWSGLVTTLVLVHFWTLLGGMFSVTQAKRVYGPIGAGSVLGAIAGSGAASALARAMAPRQLLLAASLGFAASALMPAAFRAATAAYAEKGGSRALADDARYVARQPYARSVAMLAVASATCLTVADFVFKSVVAANVPRADLGAFLATVYFLLNLLSLGAQLFVASWVIRRFALSTALAVLPALLMVGGVGMIAAGGMVGAFSLYPALVIKGADGGLRYSLHKTSSELLFVPLSEEARGRVRAFVDAVGQRGGQALASLGILLVGALKLRAGWLPYVLVLLALAWVAVSLDLRRHYLELFRGRLQAGRVRAVEAFPELDVASLETLLAALDSEQDDEVVAALDVLEREGKTHVVPALILYHPSERVVERALALFTRAGRRNVAHVTDRLLDHASPRVRAAAVVARSAIAPDAKLLAARLEAEASPEVRAAIVASLAASAEGAEGEAARARVAALVREGGVPERVALANAIGWRPAGFDGAVAALAAAPESPVRQAALGAIRRAKSAASLPALVPLLAREDTRGGARAALVEYGEAGLDELGRALADASRPAAQRWQLPRAVAEFDSDRAAALLLARLPAEPDGMVRYRIIRALESMARRHPALALDRGPLERAARENVARAYRCLDRRLTLERGAAADPARATPGHGLLVRALLDKEAEAVDRLFRLLDLTHPREGFAQIYRGVRSGRANARADGIELLHNVLRPPLRGAVVGLVDDAPEAQRLAAGADFHAPLGLSYEALLGHLLESTSRSLQDLTLYHVGELRLARFLEPLRARRARGDASSDLARTLAILEGRAPAGATV
ncbi:MAG TPA: Npt1/Npt2 family nucleotide transporter [Polyangiaceae bacterium]|nr:Npt1/Npt2 family nucleotide transporter [Polyangiaceae bacterium]